ncbi:DUF5710 domain-containing protein [Burkholderia gladioli]
MRINLSVPFKEKDEARRLGAVGSCKKDMVCR